MFKFLHAPILLGLLLGSVSAANAQVSIGIGLPNVSIGVNLPVYPQFTVVPGYPVYYAPRVDANLFFYDGMYWLFQDDYWYTSSWYNGPWELVEPEYVPLFILRVPVRYYRSPPAFFRGWRLNASPRWGDHWGRGWERHRDGWDRWNRRAAPRPAPLPTYQRHYSGKKYPQQVERQRQIIQRNYRYQPRDPEVRRHFQGPGNHNAPARTQQPVQQGQQPNNDSRREQHQRHDRDRND